jgi:hypothetical protein
MMQPKPKRRHLDAARHLADKWPELIILGNILARAFARWEAKGYENGEKAGIAEGVKRCAPPRRTDAALNALVEKIRRA